MVVVPGEDDVRLRVVTGPPEQCVLAFDVVMAAMGHGPYACVSELGAWSKRQHRVAGIDRESGIEVGGFRQGALVRCALDLYFTGSDHTSPPFVQPHCTV